MRITKLTLEDLAVDSFATGRVPSVGGTVRGHWEQATSEPVSFPEGTCGPMDSCGCSMYTQPATCKFTCADETCVGCPTGPDDPACQVETDWQQV